MVWFDGFDGFDGFVFFWTESVLAVHRRALKGKRAHPRAHERPLSEAPLVADPPNSPPPPHHHLG